MAATVIINEVNGASPGTRTSKGAAGGTVRFKNADNATVNLVNPLVIPTTGQEYSFEKWLRLEITDAGGFTQISNLQAYMDGSNDFTAGSPSEVLIWYAVAGSYQAPEVPSESVQPPQSRAAGSPVENMTDLFTATSASPIDMDAINTGPFTNGSPTEQIGDYLVMVMEVRPGATAGVLTAEVLTFGYDEI
jgi:hypothetical protein